MSVIEELMQAGLAATEERRKQALKVLRGEEQERAPRAVSGPALLGVAQAARFLGVSRTTIWRMVRAGTLTPVELMKDSTRIRRTDLEAIAGVAP